MTLKIFKKIDFKLNSFLQHRIVRYNFHLLMYYKLTLFIVDMTLPNRDGN